MKFISLYLFLFLGLTRICAQGQTINTNWHSSIFGSDREIKIYLPADYEQNDSEAYAVLYLLDAQSAEIWELSTGIIAYLVGNRLIMPTIVVGIVSEDRSEEFDPDSKQLVSYLAQEVIPYVGENLRVSPVRILLGHSWGGAFIGNLLFSPQHDLFQAYIGISPGLGANDGVIFQAADSMLQAQHEFRNLLYCVRGDLGYRELEAQADINQLDSLLKTYPNEQLIWGQEVIAASGHWTCVAPGITQGLLWVNSNFWPNQQLIQQFSEETDPQLLAQIANFYDRQQELLGYTYQPHFNYWRFLADDFREQGNAAAAAALYQHSIAAGNQGSVCYFNLAQSFEALADIPAAVNAYQNCLRRLEEQKEALSPDFYRALKDAALNAIQNLE